MSEEALWQPSEKAVASTQWHLLRTQIETRNGLSLPDSETFHAWSIARRDLFWDEIWQFCKVKGERQGPALVEGATMREDQWFPESKLNFAQNLLSRRDDKTCIIFCNESGLQRSLSFAELYAEVSRTAQALANAGLTQGDRVGAYLPNMPEAIIYMLAATSLGAIWSSCSPDFGPSGVIDRFGQIEPKFLIAVDGYRYAGKEFDLRPKIAKVLDALTTIEKTIVIPYRELDPDLSSLSNTLNHKEFTEEFKAQDIHFEQFPFSHPLYILYSSGTTGKPKCIVHGAGGTLLQHLKEHRIHTNIRPDERLFYFTTCGWMMWNWLVSGLAAKACLVLYDGSPFAPTPNAMFDLIDAQGIQIFGTSAKFIDAVAKAELSPRNSHHLESLRTILSTGSPLSPDAFDFVYREIKKDIHLASISGGTDIVSCFVLGDPTRPVFRGEIQGKGLGMDVQVWNDEGKRVFDTQGELVCCQSFPSMPVCFWNDEDGSRYHSAYFDRFEGVWCHGDFTQETARGGFIISGRSDATLNPGGVRIGTAEIYRQVESLPEVVEAVVIGQPFEDDVRIVLFVVLREGLELDDMLRKKIRTEIKENASPRHIPARILQVGDIPKTRSGKISELTVKRAVCSEAIKNLEALANPESIDAFRNREELKA